MYQSKKKSSRARRSEAATNEPKEVVKVPEVLEKRGDLRKVPPVQRMRGLQAELRKKLEKGLQKLELWETLTDTQSAKEATLTLGGILNELDTLDEHLADLEKSGFSPARKSYTAQAGEGDHVTVLEDKRDLYSEIMEPTQMINLVVVKKQPGKSGGLVVESADSVRMRVAVSHVVCLSKAA